MKPMILCKRIYWHRFTWFGDTGKRTERNYYRNTGCKGQIEKCIDVVDKIIAGGTLDRKRY